MARARLRCGEILRKVARQERMVLFGCFVLLAAVFLLPLIFTKSWIAAVAGPIGAALSAFAMLYFFWNRPINHINQFFEQRTDLAVEAELARLQMDYLQRYMQLDYKACRVNLLVSDQTKPK